MVLSPDGKWAYATLQSEGAVAVVDLDKRVRTARIEAVRDAKAMAISEDGGKLWVASQRSGQPSRYPTSPIRSRTSATTLSRFDVAASSSATATIVMTTEDPRPELVAAGQAYFTGAGRDYGESWSCNSCHAAAADPDRPELRRQQRRAGPRVATSTGRCNSRTSRLGSRAR